MRRAKDVSPSPEEAISQRFGQISNQASVAPLLSHRKEPTDLLSSHARFTCGFFKNADGTFAMDRVEGLQRGRTFKDLACAGSISLRPSLSARAASNSSPEASAIPHQSSSSVVSNHLYSNGCLAWQLTPAPGEWAHPIIVHDLRAHQRWDLSLPSMRTRGIKLLLWALGNKLVVARVVGERILYAQEYDRSYIMLTATTDTHGT